MYDYDGACENITSETNFVIVHTANFRVDLLYVYYCCPGQDNDILLRYGRIVYDNSKYIQDYVELREVLENVGIEDMLDYRECNRDTDDLREMFIGCYNMTIIKHVMLILDYYLKKMELLVNDSRKMGDSLMLL